MSLDLIAKYYDLIHADLEEDLPMWETLCAQIKGTILEIGCGTGRLLLPLIQAGHHLTGLDLSPVALSATRAKVEAAGLSQQVTLIQADMRHFNLPHPQHFVLALLPLNTFMHCHTITEQIGTLQAIHHHLQPGGQLIVDLFNPDPNLLVEADGHLHFEAETIDDLTERTVQWYWRHDIDLGCQMRHLTYILDEIDSEGLVRRTQIPFSLRFVYRYEMELLLQMAGFKLQTLYGSYQFDSFHGYSPRMIFVAQKSD